MKIVKFALGGLIALAFSVALIGGGTSAEVASAESLASAPSQQIDWP